jgi:glutamate N-acetyltransferase/amino-acid N-acetyltransferase
MERIADSGVLAARGFHAAGVTCGIKSAAGALDLGLIVSDGPATAAGVFTKNRFAAASVQWDRSLLPADDVRAVVVNSGNANSCTGERGDRDVRTSAALVAELVGCRPEQVCTASTGIIGHPLPMDRVLQGIRDAHAGLGADAAADLQVARAIMTTDTRPKRAAVRAQVGGSSFAVGGIAKGSGMIAPSMATMLVFITTDAAVPADVLQQAVSAAADRTFNRITVDGDSSTNDMVIVLANGAADAVVAPAGAPEFAEALEAVMRDLCMQMVRDGEGATKFIEVRVSGARSEQDADTVARAVAESQLVKCAAFGGDPNWGRIVCAIGYSGADVEPERVSVDIGDVRVFEAGMPTGRDASAQMKGGDIVYDIRLGLGGGEATVWTCDLSYDYVKINAEYHT